MKKVEIYDTTLRDGAQAEGVSAYVLLSRQADEGYSGYPAKVRREVVLTPTPTLTLLVGQ